MAANRNQNANPAAQAQATPPQGGATAQANPAKTQQGGDPVVNADPTSGAETQDQNNAGNGSAAENTGGSSEVKTPDSLPASATPPKKEETGGETKRIVNEGLKGKKVMVGKVEVQADENGVLVVPIEQYQRLLTIPGYKEV